MHSTYALIQTENTEIPKVPILQVVILFQMHVARVAFGKRVLLVN